MAYKRWNADNAALLFIDHQVGTINWMHSASLAECKRNILALDRIRQAGGSFVSTVQIMSEMVANWAEDAGPTILPILSELYAALE